MGKHATAAYRMRHHWQQDTNRKIRKIIMTPPKGTSTLERLSTIEAQTTYIVKQVDNLIEQFAAAEKTRADNLVEYKVQHASVVGQCNSTAADLKKLEDKVKDIVKEDGIIDTIKKNISALDDRIAPLLTAHKILVWVAIFFGTSLGVLVWGIITHTVSIVYNAP